MPLDYTDRLCRYSNWVRQKGAAGIHTFYHPLKALAQQGVIAGERLQIGDFRSPVGGRSKQGEVGGYPFLNAGQRQIEQGAGRYA